MSWLGDGASKGERQRTFGKARSTSVSANFAPRGPKVHNFEIAVDVEDDPFNEATSTVRSSSAALQQSDRAGRGLRVHNDNTTGRISPVNEKDSSTSAATKAIPKRKNSYKAEENKEVKKKRETRTGSPVHMEPSTVQSNSFGQSGV